MLILIILALFIAIVAVIFALQNLTAVSVAFLFWSFNGSLALVLLGTLFVGVLISTMVSMPDLIRSKWTVSSQKKKLAALEAERNTYQERAAQAEKEVKDLEEQMASLSAELDKSQTQGSIQPT
jgi:uncharacterized integral membrane protein